MKRAGKIFLSVFVLVIFALNLSFTRGSQNGALYLDSTKFKPALNLIKDDPNFSITIGIIDGKEYLLTVRNKVTGEETNSNIMQSSNADFEDYCLNVLGIDLHTMLGIKLSEKQKEGTVTFDKCDINGDGNVNVADITAIENANLNNMCYALNSLKYSCITTGDIRNCILSGKCSNAYDLNNDGDINVADIAAIENANLNNMCYTSNSLKNSCITTGDIRNCILSGKCSNAYDLNNDGDINVADIAAIENANLNNMCYTLNSLKNSCITTDDIRNCILSGNRSNACDLNNDGDINVADVEIFNDKCLGGGDVKMCDLNGDGKVDVADLETFNNCALGETKTNTVNKCDINGDGKIDVADVETFNDKCLGGGDVKMCDLNEDGKVDVADLETFNEICLKGEVLNTDNCEKVSDYPLTDCPDGAMCSSIVCNNERKYKVDTCQPDYEMVDGKCTCHRIYTNSVTTDGTYDCACPYPDLCFMKVGTVGGSYSSDGTKMSDTYFILDDEWAAAAGIENIDSIWDKRVGLNGAGEVISVLQHYMSPANCEEIGQKYFSEKGKDLSVIYDEYKGCRQTCQCTDLDNCPENMKNQCLKSCGNNKKEPWETCTNCPQDFRNECVGKKIPLNPNHLTPDDLLSTSREPKEEKCEKNPDYSWTACPDGAICTYADCGDRYGYKIESCQNDYEFKDGTCKCHKQLHITGELAGRYSCSMCHSEWGGNMCTLDVKMESMCTEYENGSSCSKQNYTAGGARMYDIYFFLGFEAADALGIDADRLAQTKTLLTRGDRLHYGYRNGEDTEHDFYNHDFYMTEKDCEDIGERYFGSKSKGKEIDLPNGYSDNSCKQDCTGFDLNACPENKKCLVCGDKFKVVGDQYENKGWKCYKISDGMEESDECDCDSYVNKSKDGTWVTSEEPGCSVDTYMCQSETTGEKFYSGVCGGCNLGYEMKEPGKCEYIPCGADFWMEAQMNIACPEDAWKFGITCNDEYMKSAKEFVPMNGCTQAGKQFCEKHYGSDSYVGNQKWLKGFGYGDERDGCRPDYAYTYFKCTECESGYTLKNGACVADSGVGSIYYYKGDENKPIGIVFEETDDTIKIVSLQDLGGIKYDYSKGFFTPHGTYYFWEDAMAAVKQYAPNECETGSFCGKGKWRIPTREEMLKVSKNFADGGPLVQAIRGLEASCSKENSMNLLTHRYWTSTSVIQHTNVESVYGGADIDAAYVIYHPIANDDYPDTSGKKNSIQSVEEYARPVLTIYK